MSHLAFSAAHLNARRWSGSTGEDSTSRNDSAPGSAFRQGSTRVAQAGSCRGTTPAARRALLTPPAGPEPGGDGGSHMNPSGMPRARDASPLLPASVSDSCVSSSSKPLPVSPVEPEGPAEKRARGSGKNSGI